MEKDLYFRLEDNADMDITLQSMRQVYEAIELDIADIEPAERENVFYTITPVYMTYEEFNNLSDV